MIREKGTTLSKGTITNNKSLSPTKGFLRLTNLEWPYEMTNVFAGYNVYGEPKRKFANRKAKVQRGYDGRDSSHCTVVLGSFWTRSCKLYYSIKCYNMLKNWIHKTCNICKNKIIIYNNKSTRLLRTRLRIL